MRKSWYALENWWDAVTKDPWPDRTFLNSVSGKSGSGMRVGLAASVGVSSSAHVSFIYWVPGDLQNWRKLVAVVICMSVRFGQTWGWVGLERRSGMGTLSGGKSFF